jgi:transposase-like protein
MGAHTDSLVSRLEVVEVGRRRRWSDAEKLRIVAESMAGRRLVSQPKPSPKIGDDRQRHPRPRAALRQGLRARPPTPPHGTLPR